MLTKLKINNIVMVGLFDLSKFDKYFFIKNNIVSENEILESSMFSAINAIQLVTNKFTIIVTVNQIIVSGVGPGENEYKINDIIESIIKFGNLLTVTALGINFHWELFEHESSLEELSKKLFYSDTTEVLSEFFNTNDSMFGVYASKNYKDSRLKLDVKPFIQQEISGTIVQQGIVFVFNFHFDIKSNTNNSELLNYIADYSSYKEESEKIISIYKK